VRSILFYALSAIIVATDQLTKAVVMARIPPGASERVIGRFLSLTPTTNTGGAFSLFQARNGAFVAIAFVAIAAIVIAYQRYQRRDLWASAALSLALGGAIGNLIDRLRFHYVQDFFDIHVWPIFNIADSAITCGIVILAAIAIFRRAPESQPGRQAD
jgi:signal peptidase II